MVMTGARIDPDLLLAVFLPALLFESSFAMELHQIKVPFYFFLPFMSEQLNLISCNKYDVVNSIRIIRNEYLTLILISIRN